LLDAQIFIYLFIDCAGVTKEAISWYKRTLINSRTVKAC